MSKQLAAYLNWAMGRPGKLDLIFPPMYIPSLVHSIKVYDNLVLMPFHLHSCPCGGSLQEESESD